ncbi:retrovirus-related Pol polyprotein from transposon opus [Trichonephila clavipes]|nr:retrovirus-related Pol polyprotein from transposon opus [Trichonephila clavipes]
MEAVPIPDCKAETTSKAFYEHWVCRFRVPGKIITDQGRQFESQFFRSLAAICGAKVAHANSYHTKCNGKGERLHRTWKGAIKAQNNIKWTDTLPTVLLGLGTALRPDTNHTIAQMVYGSNIRLPELKIAISHQKNSSPGHDKIHLQSINHLPIKAINLLLKSFNPPTGQNGFFRSTREASKMDCTDFSAFKTWEVERGKFYDPVRSLLKSKIQEINRLELAVKLPWAIFFESVDILS